MDQVISLETLNILAFSKLLLAFLLLFFIIGFKRRYGPVYFLSLAGSSLFLFYFILSYRLKTMLWGTTGDEILVASYLGKVMFGNPRHDFFYDWLPNFYPPLYFWLTGLLAKFTVHNAISAAKIGVLGTLVIWFWGAYYWQRVFWFKIFQGDKNNFSVISSRWFAALLPILFLLLLDFDGVIFKPFEALSSLLSIIWLIFWSVLSRQEKWDKVQYLFLGLSSGLLFLLFYFWWFILLPIIFVLALLSPNKKEQIKRFLLNAILMAIVSAIFWLPLLLSFIKYGLENWQAKFFVFADFFTFNPWATLSWKSLLFLFSFLSLLYFYKKSIAVKSVFWVLLFSYLYQLLSIVLYLLGYQPIQAYKPFMFLGGAALAVGLTMGVLQFFNYLKNKFPSQEKIFLILGVVILFSHWPLLAWLDNPLLIQQIEKDQKIDLTTQQLVQAIKKNVPNYQQRTWLSSGKADLNAYIDLSYYISFSPHFSHQAVLYSQRLEQVKAMSQASNADDFMKIINQGKPRQIDSLLLYDQDPNNEQSDYLLFFWADNYPNGGQELLINLPKKVISGQYWQLVYNKDNWRIFLKKL